MLISDRNQFIFVHTRKAAGSSITCALSKFLGPWDLQIGAVGDMHGTGIRPNLRTYMQACFINPIKFSGSVLNSPGSFSRLNSLNKTFAARYLGIYSPHISAKDLERLFPDKWANYLTISVTRNPWEAVVSNYLYTMRNISSRPSFDRFVAGISNGEKKIDGIDIGKPAIPNHTLFMYDNKPIVDVVLKFDDLAAEFCRLCKKMGLQGVTRIPHAKKAARDKRYSDFYSPWSRRVVEEMNLVEINYFKYQFPL